MKLVLAPDSFKGSLSSNGVASAMEKGVKQVMPEAQTVKIPMADGGEGTVDALVHATRGSFRTTTVMGPLGEPVEAGWGVLGDGETAVIEMAAASGLPLVPVEKRNPLETTTYGTGQLIAEAVKQGCRKIIVGIGGSATTDFGTGMAQALGIRFLRADGSEITEPMNGRLMGEVAEIDASGLPPELAQTQIYVACDVDNPLLGPRGAVYVYSPQKGADARMCEILEANMAHIADVVARDFVDVRNLSGAGAAGGLGGGLVAFLNARLKPGITLVMDACRFRERIRGADLVLTGEGRIDDQTAHGKTIAGVAGAAREQGIPVIALAGSMDAESAILARIGVAAAFSICNKPMSLEQAMRDAAALITNATRQICGILALNQSSRRQ